MATNKELQRQVEQLRVSLAGALGYDPLAPASAKLKPEERPGYLAFGSPEHAAFLGLIEVEASDEGDFITHTSKSTGRTYRLEDEVTAFMQYASPEKAAKLVLRQKINVFEAGPPTVPLGAPPLWQPSAMFA